MMSMYLFVQWPPQGTNKTFEVRIGRSFYTKHYRTKSDTIIFNQSAYDKRERTPSDTRLSITESTRRFVKTLKNETCLEETKIMKLNCNGR